MWLDGRLVAPDDARLSADDPGVRWGLGLFETMRASGGRVPLLDRHLHRLAASAAALGLAGVPDEAAVRDAVAATLSAHGGASARVRLTVTPRPTLLVEATPLPADVRPGVPGRAAAVSLPGAWAPGNRIAEHKTLSYAAWRVAQSRAEAAGAGHALLLDGDGRLGEAAVANVFCALADGVVVTAPADGLLPGIARAICLGAADAAERAPEADEWRAAREIVAVNALRGAVAITAVDGATVGDGAPGPLASALAAALAEAAGGS
ncbi:MAG TPA: aminotransferase class IV [Miltoncostaeaceae bacterium]|nr:aminotransferase class IV [Miltoncostaeaceae bacterium]